MSLSYSAERTEKLLALISNQLQLANLHHRFDKEPNNPDHRHLQGQIEALESEVVKQRQELNIIVSGL
jgi:hypothetical protein